MIGAIATGTIRTSAVLAFKLALQASNLLLLTYTLQPEDFGRFLGTVALAILLGTLSTAGTHFLLLEAVSKNTGSRNRVMSFSVPTTILVGTVLLCIYTGICLSLLQSGFNIKAIMMLGFTETILQPLLSLARMERLGRGYAARSQLITTYPILLRTIALSTIWVLEPHDPLICYIALYPIASILVIACATSQKQYRFPPLNSWMAPPFNDLRRSIGFAVMGVATTSPGELDKALAMKLLSPDASGVYSAASRVIGALTLPVAAMMISALPRLFRDGYTNNSSATRLVKWTFWCALSYGTAGALALWLSAPYFSSIFGDAYHNVGTAIAWLSAAVPAMALRVASGNALMSLGKPWIRTASELTGVAVLVTAAVPLAMSMQIRGLTLALIITEWYMAVSGITLTVFTLKQARTRTVTAES